MKSFYFILIIISVLILSCKDEISQLGEEKKVTIPTNTTNEVLETRRGYFSSFSIMQHPMLAPEQNYLDIYDQEGNWQKQIILVFEENTTKPESNAPIEVKGTIRHIDMGGPSGTKNEYQNDIFTVKTWTVLDSKDIPRKKE